jgi:hypothetical protein
MHAYLRVGDIIPKPPIRTHINARRNRAHLDNWFSESCETRSPVYMVHAKPVFSVPATTGMVSSTDAASENGVSLFHARVRISASQSTALLKLLTYHRK